MMRMRAVDIAQPDVCDVGGLTRAPRVAAMAAGAGWGGTLSPAWLEKASRQVSVRK
jgi:L-alanine-DL-glutamate epimerase-like enolase superfamily enzyme